VNKIFMNKGSVSRTVAAAATAGSLLWAGCTGTVSDDESAPAQVRQPMRTSAVPRLAVGRFHGVALKPDDSVWAWGLNSSRQLGDGTNTNRSQPVAVQGVTGPFVTVAAGFYHSMALHDDGSLWVWGSNDTGQLGNGSTAGNGPLKVVFPTKADGQAVKVVAMDGGEGFSLALDADGNVWAWGSNSDCQLGNGGAGGLSPVQVTKADDSQPLTGVVAIAAGIKSALAVREDGTVWAWGDDAYGILGNGATLTADQCRAMSITLALGGDNNAVAVDVSMGYNHSLALLSNGNVNAWGNNSSGQLGMGSSSDGSPSPASSADPLLIPNFTGVTQINAGAWHSLAVSQNKWFAWGGHGYGQLCSGSGAGYSTSKSTVPVPASVAVDMLYVGGGEYFSMGMATNKTLWSCGDDAYGQLGYDPGVNYTQALAQVPSFP
jgi:alpha-tubulin suppressor-like RCC1 family protein